MIKKHKIRNNKLKLSSRNWLNRHINDQYVQKAKSDGYVCRSAYKFLELQEKFGLIDKNIKSAIDLGAAPGSWTQVIAKFLSKYNKTFKIYAIDLKDICEIPNVSRMKLDCLNTQEIIDQIALSTNVVDLIVSDMAPSSCGDREIDHLRIMELAEAAHEISLRLLKSNGALVVKLLQGSEERKFKEKLMENFCNLQYFKPKASYSGSREVYLIAYKRGIITSAETIT